MGKLYLKLSLILFLGIALASCDSAIVDQSAPYDLSSGTADQQFATSETDIIEGEYLMLLKATRFQKTLKEMSKQPAARLSISTTPDLLMSAVFLKKRLPLSMPARILRNLRQMSLFHSIFRVNRLL